MHLKLLIINSAVFLCLYFAKTPAILDQHTLNVLQILVFQFVWFANDLADKPHSVQSDNLPPGYGKYIMESYEVQVWIHCGLQCK